MTVWFTPISHEIMVEHCKEMYPREGCGILVGTRSSAGWFVVRSVPVPNKQADERTDRFEIDPRDYLRVEREAQKEGWSVLGFFHSHPDAPPNPSATDAAFAWADSLTVIVAVYGGTHCRVRSHLFLGFKKGFTEVPVFVAYQPIPSGEVPELPVAERQVDLVGEVEPFVSLKAREAAQTVAGGSVLALRFDHELALYTLPRLLLLDGHTVLMVCRDGQGVWQLVVRARSDC